MKGKRIAVLESRLGEQLVELVARRGAVPVHAPALSETPDIDLDLIRALIEQWPAEPTSVAIFQTGVGARALFAATDELGLTARFLELLALSTVIVRGPKPTGVLRGRQVRIDHSAAEPFTTTEVLAALETVPLSGSKVFVQQYGEVNASLDAALSARGASVTEIPTYRWGLPTDLAPLLGLMDALEQGSIDAVVFTSASQVVNLFAVAQNHTRADALRAALNRTMVVSIGPVCSRALRQHGMDVQVEASPPKLGPLLEALDRTFS